MPETTITVDLYGAARLNNSRNGNPRFTLRTSDGPIATQTDAAIGYEVENFTRGIDPDRPPRVVLSLTRSGHVWNIEEATR